jgi:hypothetical protein
VTDSLEVALQQRVDLNKYESNKRLLFALQLAFGIEDIDTIAATALTDNGNDKACDLLYVDREAGRVVLAQGYEASGKKKEHQAPAGKAASLHQAVNWLFSKDPPADVPDTLLSAWRELHDALRDDAIGDVQIWYVHNCLESKQAADEIRKARDAAYGYLSHNYPGNEFNVSGIEIDRQTLSLRYESSRTPILVSDTFRIKIPGAFEERGEKWRALCTSVSADWLYERYEKYGANLFSPNVRGYLGSQRSKANINNGIQETVRHEPANLWAYNNGITALVHSFRVNGDLLEITGLGIVNGAQTTGAIGSVLNNEQGREGHVLARFIQCDDPETVRNIVRYNNRQNPTQASDFRSNDGIQTRLVRDFEKLGVVGYNGGRRGGAEDVIRRPGENQLSASVAAQALAAFHGRSDIAYHETRKIWEQDAIYASVFPERVTAQHIAFVASLLRTVEEQKARIGQIAQSDRTKDQAELHEWLSLRGSIMLAVEAVGATIEILLGAAVSDPYTLRFKRNLTMARATEAWTPVVESLLAFASDQLREPLMAPSALRNREVVNSALSNFRSLAVSARKINSVTYSPFADLVSK